MTLSGLFSAHIEWSGCRTDLPPAERRNFARWVARVHPEIAAPYRSEPARFRLLCEEVRRGVMPMSRRGVGQRVLERHASALVGRYLAEPEETRGTFAVFLERIVAACATERALMRFLRMIPHAQ